MESADWKDVLLPLLTLASQLEDEGQYSLAKLARATVDSLGRRASYQHARPINKQELVEALGKITNELAGFGVEEDLLAALRRGTSSLSEGRLALINDTPHPYVCRTCGHIVLGAVTEKCSTCGAWPDTFQWFAPNYWFEALDPFTAVEKLRQMPLEVEALLRDVPEQAMTRQPQESGWALRNILTHLRDSQGVLDYRLELFEKEEHPKLESKAIFEWATRREENPPTTQDIFSDYKATRAKILARLEDLPLADWWRTGQHEEFGTLSIKQQVSYFASHELTHLPQIERLRKTFKEMT